MLWRYNHILFLVKSARILFSNIQYGEKKDVKTPFQPRILKTLMLIIMVLTAAWAISDLAVEATNKASVSASQEIKIFWDEDLANTTSRIDWGFISPGSAKTITLYILNCGSLPITLTLSGSWEPNDASAYLNLTWNREGTVLEPNQAKPATLTLQAHMNASQISTFSLDITIHGLIE